MADFDFFANDTSLSYLRQGVPAMLCTDLSQVGSLDVLARKTMLTEIRKEQQLAEDGLIDKATASRAGKLLGAAFLLGGAVHIDGNRLRLDAQVVDVATGRLIFSTTASGPKDEASSLESQLAEQVAESMCGSIGQELSQSERLAVRGVRKGGFDSFALYSRAAIAERAGEYEKARLIFNEVMASHPDGQDQAKAVAAALRSAANPTTLATSGDPTDAASRSARLAQHKAKWTAIHAGDAQDATWLASPILLSVHAGLAGDFEQEWQLLGDYWRRFMKHVPPTDAIATADDIASVIRAEEEFFRATVDSGDYSGVPGMGNPDDNVHADVGSDVHWPRFSRLWPFDASLRTFHNTATHVGGEAAEMVKASFMARLPRAPHDYLEIAVRLRDATNALHPDADRIIKGKNRMARFPLLCGNVIALCGNVIGYCSQIPSPPERMLADIQDLHFEFLNGLDQIPSTVNLDSFGSEFLGQIVPVLDALSKTAPKRDHRELAQRLLTRFGRQLSLVGEHGGNPPPGSEQPASLFGVPITTSRVLIVWHEEQTIAPDVWKQEAMVRRELADFILALPAETAVNAILAFGSVMAPDKDARDEWLLKEPTPADAQSKRQLLEALDPETRGEQSTKGSLSNALRAALEASGDHTSTVVVVRLRDQSKFKDPLVPSPSDKRASVTLHAVMSRESATLAELVRTYRGSMILLESDGDLVGGKVQKRIIDTAKD